MRQILSALFFTLVLAVAASFLAACRPSMDITAGSTEMDVSILAETCSPGQWTLLADREITVMFHNQQDTARHFTVMTFPVTPTAGSLNTADVLWTHRVPPGDSTAAFTTPPTAGEYDVLCGPEGSVSPQTLFHILVTQPEK